MRHFTLNICYLLLHIHRDTYTGVCCINAREARLCACRLAPRQILRKSGRIERNSSGNINDRQYGRDIACYYHG